MADVEKAISGIRKCLSRQSCGVIKCPYMDECAVSRPVEPLLRDALELLKEQNELIKQYKSACESCKSRLKGGERYGINDLLG